jgi:ribosomal protein L10
MIEVFNKYEELRAYFKEVREILGKAITQEVVSIFEVISKGKLGSIEEIQRGEID